MNIGLRQIGPGQPPYVIAELGVNHDGSVDRALQLMEAAQDAGADAIKLQWFEASRLLSRAAVLATYQSQAGATDPFTMLEQLELDFDQLSTVAQAATERGLHAIVTVFNHDLVERAMTIPWDAFKVASPDIINRPLLEALISTQRPLLVSTGAASMDEIHAAHGWLGAHPHMFMQCVSSYPTPDAEAALGAMTPLCELAGPVVGYSDHTNATDTGGLAVAAGAHVLEKHFTLDRGAVGPDHQSSLDADGLRTYIRLAHRAYEMVGPAEKRVLDIEADVRHVSRQSVVTTHSIPEGHTLTAADLTLKRPGTGIPASKLHEVVGRRVRSAIESDIPITEEHLI